MSREKTIYCPSDRRFKLVLDPSECFPDDPGNGTPAMVYGPNRSSGTYNCVSNEGELICGPTVEIAPDNVIRWLHSEAIVAAVEAVWDEA